MSTKSKGTNAERELIHKLWAQGYAAIRSAGSGSMKYPSPDILTAKEGRILAIECKVTKGKSKYFEIKEIDGISIFYINNMIDLYNAPSVKAALESHIIENNKKQIIINCKKIKDIDSSGAGTLLYINKMITEKSGRLILCECNEKLKSLFRITQLGKILKIVENENDAISTIIL